MPASLSNQAYLPGSCLAPSETRFQNAFLVPAGTFSKQSSVFSKVLVSRMKRHLGRKGEFCPDGMTICRGAPQAKNGMSKKQYCFTCAGRTFFQLAELRIEGQAEAWLNLPRPSVYHFFKEVFRASGKVCFRGMFRMHETQFVLTQVEPWLILACSGVSLFFFGGRLQQEKQHIFVSEMYYSACAEH